MLGNVDADADADADIDADTDADDADDDDDARARGDATATHSVTSLVARVQPARICFTHETPSRTTHDHV